VTTMASEKIILDLDDIQGSLWHSAGALTFGPDGKLYVGVGENGGRPFLQNAQLLTNPFGKVFRINSDGTIPADNPFYAQTTGIYRGIWALGFRNPFTFSFQAGTGRFFVNDVGADSWEEINDVVQGGNFGWPNNEGTVANTTYRNPIFTYPHGPVGTDNVGCAITGGTFYNPAIDLYPSQYVGKYFFIDYCNNWMRTLNPDHSVTTFATDLSPNPISLQVGPDGAFYYISFWFKNIYRIGYKAPQS
jgi:glucose/arabinose dehydrogenase